VKENKEKLKERSRRTYERERRKVKKKASKRMSERLLKDLGLRVRNSFGGSSKRIRRGSLGEGGGKTGC